MAVKEINCKILTTSKISLHLTLWKYFRKIKFSKKSFVKLCIKIK